MMINSGCSVLRFAPCLWALLLLTGPVISDTGVPQRVVVKAGDTLSSIVIREIGSRDPFIWEAVAEFNNRTSDQILEIGDVLLIPDNLQTQQSVVIQEITKSSSEANSESGGEAENDKEVVATDTGTESENSTVTFTEMKNEPVAADPFADSAQDSVTSNAEQASVGIQANSVETCEGQQVCLEEQGAGPAPEPNVADRSAVSGDGQDGTQEPQKNVDSAEAEIADVQTLEPSTAVTQSPDPTVEPTIPAEQTTQFDDSSESTADESSEDTSQQQAEAETETQAETQTQAPRPQPGLFEVDEDAAVRALERSLVQINALLLKPGRAEASLSLDYSFDSESEPVLVTVEDTTDGTTAEQIGLLQSENTGTAAVIDLKLGMPYDSQIGVTLPFITSVTQEDLAVSGDVASSQKTSISGLGDIELSVDKTLTTEKGRRPDLIFSASFDSDSGDSDTGSNAQEISVGLTATKRQDPLVFTANISRTFVTEANNGVKSGDVTQWSLGTLLAASPYTSLQFSFSRSQISSAKVDGVSISGSDVDIASFSAGVSSVVSKDVFLNVQLGMGLVDSDDDYRLSFSLAKQFSL